MLKLLITGKNSFVGTEVEKYLKAHIDFIEIFTIDLKENNWLLFDFSKYDAVFHVAGIAHVSTKKNMEKLYFDINRDLTLKVAQQAKKANVKLFVYMSSMIVYSSREKCISNDTKPNPDNFYGRSKLEAEQGLESMQDTSFKVAILRPPMIYGKNSKGNFSKLVNYSHKLLFFPKYNNKKSILYIDNLSEMVRIILLEKLNGIFYPRNLDHVSTHEIIYYSSLNIRNKKVILIKFLNPLISVIVRISRLARKVFGDFYYDQNFGIPPMNYQRYGLEDSIKEIFK